MPFRKLPGSGEAFRPLLEKTLSGVASVPPAPWFAVGLRLTLGLEKVIAIVPFAGFPAHKRSPISAPPSGADRIGFDASMNSEFAHGACADARDFAAAGSDARAGGGAYAGALKHSPVDLEPQTRPCWISRNRLSLERRGPQSACHSKWLLAVGHRVTRLGFCLLWRGVPSLS